MKFEITTSDGCSLSIHFPIPFESCVGLANANSMRGEVLLQSEMRMMKNVALNIEFMHSAFFVVRE